MMDSRPDVAPPLQFDTVIAPGKETAAESQAVTCTVCERTLADEYFDVNGQPVCLPCRDQLAQLATVPKGWRVLARAFAFGAGAAILGAIVYYAVIAITEFEIGIVAIAIGYMVGYGIRMGTRGHGGRRFQVLAVVLTYWAVGLAYTPFAFQGAAGQNEPAAQTDASAPAAAPAAEAEAAGPVPLAFAIAFLGVLSFALPVFAIVSSMPGGLISAAIIAFGMHQAWTMTAAPVLQVTGPYRIGTAPAALA
jgi:hypothetical protein